MAFCGFLVAKIRQRYCRLAAGSRTVLGHKGHSTADLDVLTKSRYLFLLLSSAFTPAYCSYPHCYHHAYHAYHVSQYYHVLTIIVIMTMIFMMVIITVYAHMEVS